MQFRPKNQKALLFILPGWVLLVATVILMVIGVGGYIIWYGYNPKYTGVYDGSLSYLLDPICRKAPDQDNPDYMLVDNQRAILRDSEAEYSPNGRYIVTTHEKMMVIWDAATGEEIRRFGRPIDDQTRYYDIDFSQNGSLLFSYQWDWRSGEIRSEVWQMPVYMWRQNDAAP